MDNADELLPGWQAVISHSLQAVRQERASHVFINSLGQLLSGGQVLIDDDLRTPREPIPGIPTIGYHDQEYVYLLPDIADQLDCLPYHLTGYTITSACKMG